MIEESACPQLERSFPRWSAMGIAIESKAKEDQYGFRLGHGCVDQMFSVRQVYKVCIWYGKLLLC